MAGITHNDEEGDARRYMVVGWNEFDGWHIMADLPAFTTKEEAVAESWRVKATEDETPADQQRAVARWRLRLSGSKF